MDPPDFATRVMNSASQAAYIYPASCRRGYLHAGPRWNPRPSASTRYRHWKCRCQKQAREGSVRPLRHSPLSFATSWCGKSSLVFARDLCRLPIRLLMGQQRPCNARVLVGHGHHRPVFPAARNQLLYPAASRVALTRRASHDRSSAMNQQRA